MTMQHAEQILNEAKSDQRLKAEIVGSGSKARGYQVRVTLRNQRWVTVHNLSEWEDVSMAWREL